MSGTTCASCQDAAAFQRIEADLRNLGDPEPPADLVDGVMREVALRQVGSAREIAGILAAALLLLLPGALVVPGAPLASDIAVATGRLLLFAKLGMTIARPLLAGLPALAAAVLLLMAGAALLTLRRFVR